MYLTINNNYLKILSSKINLFHSLNKYLLIFEKTFLLISKLLLELLLKIVYILIMILT